MIKVLVSGAYGRMGHEVMKAVGEQDDMTVVAAVDPGCPGKKVASGDQEFICESNLADAIDKTSPDVLVDFTHPDAVAGNIKEALSKGVHCVIGTTGQSEETMKNLYNKYAKDGAKLFVAPNFTTGAVLMMEFARMAAKYFPDAEVIEFHHNGKADAPSGTALRTTQKIAEGREGTTSNAPGKDTEIDGCEGARGAKANDVYVHSVRSDGYVAHQEVILGSPGQTLTIRHDSIDRASYMPGVLLAIRKVSSLDSVVIGLEKLMGF